MSVDNRMTIRDIAQVYDGPHATPEKIDEGPYFLSISSLEKGALDLSKSAHISETDFVKWTKRVTPEEGDLLFSYETRLGDAALMPAGIVGCLGRRMGLLRPNREKVIPEYLLYAYLSPEFQEIIRANTVHGATVDRIALKDMSSFSIRIPPLADQERVVSVLSSQDKKIQLNRQINQTLEAMAQAIFQSWFVDFDPVKAKIAAREQWQILTDDQRTEWLNELLNKQDYLKTCLLELTVKAGLNDDKNVQLESSLELIPCRGHGPEGSESLDIGFNNLRKEWQSKKVGPALQSASETLYLNIAAMTAISSRNETSLAAMPVEEFSQLYKTASLFPERLVDSELGEIPEGWRVGTLGGLIEFNPRRTLKKGTVAPYLDMKNVPTSGHLADEVFDRELGSGTKFINGDTLLARITPCLENGKTAFVDFLEDNQVGWGSTEYIVMRPKANYPVSLGYFIARNEEFRQHAVQSMTGTSGRQRANSKALEGLDWLAYPIELLLEFDKLSGHYLKVARTNGDQNKSLSMIRDSLLPKLLSGELDVSSLTELSDIDPAAMDV